MIRIIPTTAGTTQHSLWYREAQHLMTEEAKDVLYSDALRL